jgi:hypothetical protein
MAPNDELVVTFVKAPSSQIREARPKWREEPDGRMDTGGLVYARNISTAFQCTSLRV